ncbi:hypothetical protein CFB77_gp1 [Aedes alboannulatus toti-like virus 1]|uniref:Uncharacterized protein n=1 Tax=Aedes camptorhynchus toti-like virus 1 TaxID=2010266 RepID=A0A1Z2RSU1_9VIRU|nr:hypothetical protein CFB77_gp1 [Aedes alboannulatus toti-like virus 1]YP_009388610.1 hypothetical protein CFB76_gp1 [Aedes camptorhynchus toti-like virus 1]ASA47276.1 hypothetical protein [Aedes camptorhynchus toti-like virus 1]ASA47458.1 hypothetical protein [Aedes alboannulatus toti-like virus 1]
MDFNSESVKKEEEKTGVSCEGQPHPDKVEVMTLTSSIDLVSLEPVCPQATELKEKEKKEKEKETTMVVVQSPPVIETRSSTTEPVPSGPPAPHYGEHSIIPQDVQPVEPAVGLPVGQDVIRKMSSSLMTVARRLVWGGNDYAVRVKDYLTWPRIIGPPLGASVESTITIMHGEHDNIQRVAIKETAPRIKAEWSVQDEPSILIGSTPDVNKIANKLRGRCDISKALAEKLACRINKNLQIHDLSGFFTSGFVLAAHVQLFGCYDIAQNVVPLAADLVITANISVHAEAEVAQTLTSCLKALNEQALSFDASTLSETDIQVIMAIAAGGPSGVITMEGARLYAATSFLDWPTRCYFIYSAKPFALPARRALTCGEIRASLYGIATRLNRFDDMAAGFVRSSTFLVGYVRSWSRAAPLAEGASPARSDARRQHYRGHFYALHETNVILVPKVRGYNFLWDLMGTSQPRTAVDDLLVPDGKALCGLNDEEVMRTTLGIGALLSCSASSVLNYFNLTARELNTWAAGVGVASTTHLKAMFESSTPGLPAPYYLATIGFAQQFAAVNIHPHCFSGMYNFSGLGAGMLHVRDDATWWWGHFGIAVPYLVQPLSMAWIWKSLADIWGCYGPNPVVDFGRDIVIGGAVDNEYMCFNRDEPLYLRLASAPAPYVYIPYGQFAINIIRQYGRITNVRWVIDMREVARVAQGAGDLGPPIINQHQPTFAPGLGFIQTGTLLTFDWDLQCILVPGLSKEVVGEALFMDVCRMGKRALSDVGVLRDRMDTAPFAPIDTSTMVGLIKGMSAGMSLTEKVDKAGN